MIKNDNLGAHGFNENDKLTSQVVVLHGANVDGELSALIPLDGNTLGRIEAMPDFILHSWGALSHLIRDSPINSGEGFVSCSKRLMAASMLQHIAKSPTPSTALPVSPTCHGKRPHCVTVLSLW
jgi:hypothetical protein